MAELNGEWLKAHQFLLGKGLDAGDTLDTLRQRQWRVSLLGKDGVEIPEDPPLE